MPGKSARLELSREQILGFRREAGSLNERLPASAKSLRLAAWGGLQDSMPRAALLSMHARVKGCEPNDWEDASLVQLWGPRFNVYVVAAKDLPVFSLGRLPDNARGRERAYNTASRLQTLLDGRRMPMNQAGKTMGVHPNSLRYAAPTGTVLLRWDGAHDAVVWSVAPPNMEPQDARLELARRHLYVFGPSTVPSFAGWAGIGNSEATAAFDGLGGELVPVLTPGGDAWILANDEASFRELSSAKPRAPARFLPSGDAYYLLWGQDRELLVPDPKRRAALWTTRVWPGALLVNGEIAGVWRRSGRKVSIDTWRRLSPPEWEAVEAEAAALPLAGLNAEITIYRS
jgi:Winged helix DNA-binding domain